MTEGLCVTVRGVHGIVLGEHCATFGAVLDESSVELPTEQASCNGQATDVPCGGVNTSAGLERIGVDLSSEEASCEVQVSDPQDDVGETRGAGLDARHVGVPFGEESCDGQISDPQDAGGEPRDEQEFFAS